MLYIIYLNEKNFIQFIPFDRKKTEQGKCVFSMKN